MRKSILKKMALACLALFFGTQVFAQGRIELNPSSRGVQISESDFKGFNSTFSFSSIESAATKAESENFSIISIAKTVNHGELGAPALPIARELIAVPFGATPVVKVVDYSTTDYKLSDFGIEKIYPQQPSYSKSTKKEDMVFHYDESAYQAARAFNNAPEVSVNVLGTMRGVQIGALQIEPVEYNPANNTVRVYNDIELEVVFENADIALTEETLIKTYSPYFDVIYKQLFNEKAINNVYDDHPDLYKAPVRMLVVANRMFEDVMQPWLEWKTQKGFYLDVKYTDELAAATADNIQAYIKEQYETKAPSFLVIFGDKDQVVPSMNSGQETGRVTDLYYATFDGDEFPDLYHSRMSCETVEQMEALINKTLQVEQYTMPDPSYLNNVLMIAGADGNWNPLVGQPSIEYATHYYYNEEHGFDNVYKYLSTYTGCYNNLNTGVGFANYTAHGSETKWSDPSFSVSDVNALTNVDKYFWAMGNCCLSADWGYSSTSFGEAMIRADRKGAWGYIGSCPLTYWLEDYYFGVGATTHTGSMPTMEQTTMGNYDAFWMEDTYNTLASVPFSGNLAVAYAHVDGGYGHAISTRYYFEAYHTLGDGSVMPYKAQPTENNVTHLPVFPIGMDYYTVSATPGSYVGISQAGTLYGAGMIDETGEADITLEPITLGGDVTIVVTHPERIPYIATVPAAAMEGAFIAVDDFSPRTALTNKEVSLSVSYKNVGVEVTEGTTTITLSSENENITIIDGEASLDVLNADAIVELPNEFSFIISKDAQDGDVITVNSIATCGSDTWESKIYISVVAPILEYVGYSWLGSFEPGETYTVMAQFENSGHYMAENVVATVSSTSEYLTIEEESYEIGTIDPDGVGTAMFEVTVSSSCPTTEAIGLAFEVTAENAQPAQGEGVIQNSCNVVVTMNDSYGDGWNNSYLTFAYNDGTPSQNISITSGSSGVENLTIGIGVNVVVTFVSVGLWDREISFSIAYEDGDVIYQSSGTPTAGVVCEFEVNCAGDEGPDVYDNTIINYGSYSLKFTVTDVFPAECEVVCETKPTSPTTITIPSIVTIEGVECSVTSIGASAFEECSNLTSIEIPSGVTSIGSFAFAYCEALSSIKCYAVEVPETNTNAFSNCPSDMKIYVPAGSVVAYKAASPWNEYNIVAIHTINGDGSWEDISNWDNQILPDEYGNVVVAGHVTISDEVTINSLDINEDKTLTILNGGTLTVISDITNTDVNALIIEEGGQIIQYNDNVAATFKNEIETPTGTWGEEDQTGWQFISSPINNVNVDEFIPENGDYDLFKYDGTNKLWINMKNIDNASFEKGIGYLASYQNEGNMALFKGNLNYLASGGSYVIEDLNYLGNENVLANFNLLGNPFPFDINWSTDVIPSNVYNGFARIKPADGAYEYFNSSGTIKSGEGFMVKTTGDNASISFSKGASKSYRKESASVNIIASNVNGSDNLIVSFEENEKAGFPKLDNFNKAIANIYVTEEDVNYGIYNYDSNIEEIPFNFDAKEIGNYTLTFDIEGEFDNLYLLDKMTGEKVNLLIENEYSFMAGTNDNPERFILTMAIGNDNGYSDDNEHFVYVNNRDLHINVEGTIQIIDMMGRVVMTEENHNGIISISNLNSAAYIVRCVNENEVKTQKIVVL